MKQAKTTQKAILDGKLPSIAVLSAALSFTLLLFSPVLVYFDDPAAFMVDLRHIFFPMLGAAAMGTLIFGGLLCLALVIHRNVYLVLSRFFLGLLLAFTVQGFFLNRGEVVLKADVDYGSHRTAIMLDTVLFWTIVFLPLILLVLGHFFPSRKLRTAAGEGALIAASAALRARTTTARKTKSATGRSSSRFSASSGPRAAPSST